MSLRVALSFVALLFLSACALLQSQEKAALSPWHLPFEAAEVSQLLKGSYQDQEFVLHAALKMDEDQLLLLGLDQMGRRAFSLTWDATGVHVDRAVWLPDALEARYILSDLMYAYWPLEKLVAQGLVVTQDGTKRTIFEEGQAIAFITKEGTTQRWAGQTVIENIKRGYRIEIQSQQTGEAQ
ncbi:DUF3261 domain-containing protein [Terasakiella pusilla]|uniref:DUF3261 domain-containing protein n=1 Tax=Terasakiella pusilla TaxID=64973 RepID=UPI00068F0CE3|nr:DUF3261 domain-containing protein [Terasakiella pusilla]